MTKLFIKRFPNTYKHFITNNIFQVELPCYFFQRDSIVSLQETYNKQARYISDYLYLETFFINSSAWILVGYLF